MSENAYVDMVSSQLYKDIHLNALLKLSSLQIYNVSYIIC